jgi:hypothetical protein
MPLDDKQTPTDATTYAFDRERGEWFSAPIREVIDEHEVWRAARPSPTEQQDSDGTEMCDACDGSGFGVADTCCGKCGGAGGYPAGQQDSDGLVERLLESATLLEASEHLGDNVLGNEIREAADRIEAMKRQLTEITQSLAELLVMVKALGHGESDGARHADKLLEPFRKALGNAL